MNDKDIIAALASGACICIVDDGYHGISYELRTLHGAIDGAVVGRLSKQGWLIGPNSYRLSDAGRAAYIRSTDELGDGKLVSPNP